MADVLVKFTGDPDDLQRDLKALDRDFEILGDTAQASAKKASDSFDELGLSSQRGAQHVKGLDEKVTGLVGTMGALVKIGSKALGIWGLIVATFLSAFKATEKLKEALKGLGIDLDALVKPLTDVMESNLRLTARFFGLEEAIFKVRKESERVRLNLELQANVQKQLIALGLETTGSLEEQTKRLEDNRRATDEKREADAKAAEEAEKATKTVKKLTKAVGEETVEAVDEGKKALEEYAAAAEALGEKVLAAAKAIAQDLRQAADIKPQKAETKELSKQEKTLGQIEERLGEIKNLKDEGAVDASTINEETELWDAQARAIKDVTKAREADSQVFFQTAGAMVASQEEFNQIIDESRSEIRELADQFGETGNIATNNLDRMLNSFDELNNLTGVNADQIEKFGRDFTKALEDSTKSLEKQHEAQEQAQEDVKNFIDEQDKATEATEKTTKAAEELADKTKLLADPEAFDAQIEGWKRVQEQIDIAIAKCREFEACMQQAAAAVG